MPLSCFSDLLCCSLRQESLPLCTCDVEIGATHSCITADAHTGPGKAGVLAETALLNATEHKTETSSCSCNKDKVIAAVCWSTTTGVRFYCEAAEDGKKIDFKTKQWMLSEESVRASPLAPQHKALFVKTFLMISKCLKRPSVIHI